MGDLSFQLKQIAQYPVAATLNPADVFLMQQGGVTGPYKSVTRETIVNGAQGMSAGLLPPLPCSGLTASFATVLNGPRSGFNWFIDRSGAVRYIEGGVAGRWSFGLGSLDFSIAPAGAAGAGIWEPWWQKLLELDYSGVLTLHQQVRCGRDPGREDEVATVGFLQRRGVLSFNGRHGDIVLNALDVNAALEVQQGNAVASMWWVDDRIAQSFEQFYFHRNFVFTFNGRKGDICLLAKDVSCALFADPLNSAAPTPPLGDASWRIATTMFVDESLADLQYTLEQELAQLDADILQDLSKYALLDSPHFSGIPTAPTAPPGTSTSQIATTAFVMNAITSAVAGVSSWNGRTGAVTMIQQDIIDAGGWASPVLTGTPTAPTPAPGDSTQKLATTAFVMAAISSGVAGVSSWNGRTGAVTLLLSDITGAGGAPIASPVFTGVPAGPTAAPGTSTTQLATTAFVTAAIAGSTAGVTSWNGRTGAVTFQANDISAVGGALLASPVFTGIPRAPNPPVGDSSTEIATTAFVTAAIAAAGAGGTTLVGSGTANNSSSISITNIPAGYGVYVLEFINLVPASVPSGNAYVVIRFSTDNGISYDSSNNYYSSFSSQPSGGSYSPPLDSGGLAQNGTYIAVIFVRSATASDGGSSGVVRMYSLSKSGVNKNVTCNGNYANFKSALLGTSAVVGSGVYGGAAPVNALQVLIMGETGSGATFAATPVNIASGQVKLYAIS